MPRAANPDLSIDWKIVLPATLAGSVEHELMNPLTGKPRYGERSKLVGWLLSEWLAKRRDSKIEVERPAADLISRDAP